ncbi:MULTISPECIES: hypothetical protein [Streptomyces]|uniref:hypothetical protein n=1 Tax=Streptomyces TaxID=1883 RepID=UPI0037CCEF7E
MPLRSLLIRLAMAAVTAALLSAVTPPPAAAGGRSGQPNATPRDSRPGRLVRISGLSDGVRAWGSARRMT